MNILILRVSSIGDVVHALPSIFLLKKLYPNAKISWVVQRKARSLLKGQPFLDNVWVIPDKFLLPKNWLATSRVLREIRKTKWDAILDFQGIIKTSILKLFIKGKGYGFDSKNSRSSITAVFNRYKVTPKYKNIIQKNLALASNMHLRNNAKAMGYLNPKFENSSPSVESIREGCLLNISKDSQNEVDAWLNANNIKNFIAISPNTTWKSKHWPLDHWKEVSSYLFNSLSEYQVVLLGKSFGEYADMLSEYFSDNNLSIYSAPEWNLITTSYLISKAQLLIAPDTGLLHIADFLDVKTIGIFGPTLAEKHGPFLSTHNMKTCIQINCPHHYQKNHGDEAVKSNCMSKLKPEMLFENVKKVLQIS